MADKSTADYVNNTGGVEPQNPGLFQGANGFTEDNVRWNSSFPYQLVVIRSTSAGYVREPGWVFTLPIPPSQMSISTPFAITTQVTLGGIVEQHNGAPLRNISFSGTTGVYPIRESGAGLKTANIAQAIFAGAIQAGQGALRTGSAALSGSPPINPGSYAASEISQTATGYYQFHLLRRFLENYVAIKKTGDGKDLFLCLLVWKDMAGYIVQPVQFDLTRSKESPWEYPYSLQFKAWGRIDPSQLGIDTPAAFTLKRTTKDPNLIAQVLNRINYARETLAGLRDAISAIKPDFDATVGEVLRGTALLLKDTLNTAIFVSDMPPKIIKGMRDTVIQGADQIGSALATGTRGAQKNATDIKKAGSYKSAGVNKSQLSADPANKIFDKSHGKSNFQTLSSIRIDSLKLPSALKQQIEAEKSRVRSLTRSDFEAQRDAMVAFVQDYSDRIGLGGGTVDRTYGRAAVQQQRTATDDDFAALWSMNDAILQMSRMAAYTDTAPTTNLTAAFDVVSAAARKSGIAFTIPTSKFAVPLPYGQTLEQVARQYLGDPNRWIEIATLNGLSSPYIDEVGFNVPLLTNGSGNTVTLATVENMYVGQAVTVHAPSVGQTARRIVRIDRIDDSYYTVQLDGAPTLGAYTTLAASQLHAYLPGTINSQQSIFIPSSLPAGDSSTGKPVPGVNDLDHMLEIGGIDMLLTLDGDLAVSASGDERLAFGLSNIVQTVKLALTTPRGSLLLHKDYGLAIPVGSSLADVSAKDLLAAAQALFSQDPTFTGVQAAQVDVAGPAVNLSLSIGVAGSNNLIPITVQVQN